MIDINVWLSERYDELIFYGPHRQRIESLRVIEVFCEMMRK